MPGVGIPVRPLMVQIVVGWGLCVFVCACIWGVASSVLGVFHECCLIS